ncbi:tRNA uridine-5-carboxymethylaminomethyl(34) synthesis GTPase MnmE [Prevotella sp. HUN102]|uniref:tRNA uridine-5-carboxymethylaminomethyl(34) synthesis GTPase MnmE n=1 Tax=Prevotella sp. HUN102 TaxID=1392486 RepID=UPI00048C8DC5|nr:tRNA uridine-5-carboxymethylaminomethyl(34) synthesis GTPase MnmE [Prevotella sp. HUN102]
MSSSSLISADTICALATQPGGAIGIVRISGNNAISIADAVFSKTLANSPANTIHYGEILDNEGKTIDEVIVSLWRAPHSYTGEDAVEISCHGSAYILEQVLHRLTEVGCRQANPGEFTQRAYFNGKMDLSQAEAVADLISSTNKASYKIALSQLKGHFSNELATLREQLLKMTSLLELELDFSDHEELEFADRTELKTLAETIDRKVLSLAHSFKTGQALKKGIPVAIVGKTNVGKSTLLNQLLCDNRAIVSDIHGTTRDVIEDTMNIKGVDFLFIDTAGLRQTNDRIEQIGIERAYEKMGQAQIVLWVIDTDCTEDEKSEMQNRCKDKKLIIVRNKTDLHGNQTLTTPAIPSNKKNVSFETENIASVRINIDSTPHSSSKEYSNAELPTSNIPVIESFEKDLKVVEVSISAKLGYGITVLEQLIYDAADIPELTENSVIVTNARHYDALAKAHNGLSCVVDALNMELSGDLVAEDLKIVIDELGKITGTQINSKETLHNIFKHFCIGK